MKMSKKEQRHIAHFNAKGLGEKLVKSWFDHPEDQGPNFSWGKVPNTAARLAKANCFTWFPHDTKITKALKGFAAGVAYNAARNCLDNLQKAQGPTK